MKKIILILLLMINCASYLYSQKIEYLLVPEHIKNFSSSRLFCFGREWCIDKELHPEIINNLLYLHYNGGVRWTAGVYYPNIRTFPGEVNQPLISTKEKQFLVVEFEKKLIYKVRIQSEIVSNDFQTFNEDVDCYKKSSIFIKLPKGVKLIHQLQLTFTGENCLIVIKSIYTTSNSKP